MVRDTHMLFDELIRKVWNVVSSITFSCDVHFALLEAKGLHKVLPEASELLSKFHLISDVRSSLCVANTDRLFNPDHVGQVGPAVRVWSWCQSSSLPQEWSILGQQSTERATTRSTIQPDGNLVIRFWIVGWEEPVQSALAR